jgi:predicted dehydrogenase
MMDMVDDGVVKYDRVCLLNVKTEKGLVGDISQDVITEPAQKIVRIQGSEGFLEWYVNIDGGHDALRYSDGKGGVREELFPKTRPDDFKGEINNIESILAGEAWASPIAINKGLETMMVVAAAHISHNWRKTVRINYQAAYGLDAIEALS